MVQSVHENAECFEQGMTAVPYMTLYYLFNASLFMLLDTLGLKILLLQETILLRFAVCPAQPIPESHELPIVIVEVQMVHCVAGWPVDNHRISEILGVICTALETLLSQVLSPGNARLTNQHCP